MQLNCTRALPEWGGCRVALGDKDKTPVLMVVLSVSLSSPTGKGVALTGLPRRRASFLYPHLITAWQAMQRAGQQYLASR